MEYKNWEDTYRENFPRLWTEYHTPEATQLVSREEDVLSFTRQLLAEERQGGEARERKLLGALEGMYEQYCTDGHHFMSAGERAVNAMQEYGYGFDDGGRLIGFPTPKKGEDVG